jgi:hypothetical protein
LIDMPPPDHNLRWLEEHRVQVNGYKGLERWQYLELELSMYSYRWAHGYTAFQAFQNDIPVDKSRVWSKRKALFDTFIVLLQSRNNVTEIWSLGWVGCPAALYQVCKCRLATSRQWRPLVLPKKKTSLNKAGVKLSCYPKFWLITFQGKSCSGMLHLAEVLHISNDHQVMFLWL